MPLNIGVCGLGGASVRAHLPALTTLAASGDVRIAAVCDRDPARLAALSGHGDAAHFANVADMVAADGLDLVVLATPPSSHLDGIRHALTAGLDVVCEKPLGLSDADVTELATLCADHPSALVVTVHQYTLAEPWATIRDAVRRSIEAGDRWSIDIAIERPGTDPLAASGWRADPIHEGGILGDHVVHYLALAHDLDQRISVTDAQRSGAGGAELAAVTLALPHGEMRITASYAGAQRSNSIRFVNQTGGVTITWINDMLEVTEAGRTNLRTGVMSLADRDVVNQLYLPFHRSVCEHHADAAWRAQATAGTVTVARLLAECIDRARSTAPVAQAG